VLGVAIAMIVIEVWAPGRAWPSVPGWIGRALLLNAAQAGMVFLGGLTWDRWFPQLRLWDLSGLGTLGGAALGYLVITFIYYWWHRARHEIPLLWRWLHQVHHSPQRIEIITSFYKHPVEILVNGILSSAIVYLVVGLAPEAAAGAVALSGLAELVYHWNVRTPHWLGYVFQRPESHCVHHQRGVHASNYSDLPLWDWVFGTLDNPTDWRGLCGFEADSEQKLGEMLLGTDVNVAAPDKRSP
jgi:sterol desaturase/sphingolipid hydroxylase (fatty acid hydroxylase superfamily)